MPAGNAFSGCLHVVADRSPRDMCIGRGQLRHLGDSDIANAASAKQCLTGVGIYDIRAIGCLLKLTPRKRKRNAYVILNNC